MTDHPNGIERLLRLAGPRETVAPERALRVRRATEAAWRAQITRRWRIRAITWSGAALAAAALVVLVLRVGDTRIVETPAVTGTLEPTGEALLAGRLVETDADAYARVRLESGVELRADRETRIRMVSASTVSLERGAVYVVSGRTASASIEVHTPFGVARDVGTRFEVRLADASLRVRVRDGAVAVEQRARSIEAEAGEELSIDAEGRVTRRPVPRHGAGWDWTRAAAPPFEIEGRSLRAFLDWISGENGWDLRFAESALEQKSSSIVLHGSIDGLSPAEALAAVLPATGVAYRLDEGILVVGQEPGAARD